MFAYVFLGLSLCLPRVVLDVPDEDPFALGEEIKQFLAGRIDPAADELQLLQQLVRIVVQESSVGFTYQNETRTPMETFNRKGGNCVSFTFLLIAMARHVGLDARFREVEVVPTWSRLGRFVSVSGHVNVAVMIGGRPYVADLFPDVTRMEVGGRIVSDARATAHFFNNRGAEFLSNRRMEEAVACFRKALASDETMGRAWINLGVAQAQIENYGQAEKSYKRALQLDSKDQVAMSNLASLYERTGRIAESRRYREKTRKLQLKNPYYHFNLGSQDFESGAYKESIEHFLAAAKLKCGEHIFHMALARAYIQIGDLHKAEQSLKQAARNAPNDLAREMYAEQLASLASKAQN